MASKEDDIQAWLGSIGLAEYIDTFVAQRIDFDILKDLEDSDLKDLGIPIGDRKRLKKAILHHDQQQVEATTVLSEPIRSERRHVTIMFIDLAGSTELSNRLDPEDYANTIKKFQRRAMSLVESWQGFIARFFGDGILAYFGWPSASEDDAERAARAALEISTQVGQLKADDGTSLACRIGIASGLVVVEDILGNRQSFQDAIYGITPNLAARLQSCAEPGEVIVSAETRQLIGNWFHTSFLGKKVLKGIDGEVDVWRVDQMMERSTRFEATSDQLQLSPLFGRKSEIHRLQAMWENAKSSRGGAALIKGEAGLGKSRLVQEFDSLSTDGMGNSIYLQCSPFHRNTAAYPVVQYFHREADLPASSTYEDARAKVAPVLAVGGVVDPGEVDIILHFIGVDRDQGQYYEEISAPAHGSRTLNILVGYFLELSANTPLKIILEDAHWIDPTTAQIFAMLFERMSSQQLFLVITARPEFDALLFDTNCQVIELDPLQPKDARQLSASITGGMSLPKDISETIFEATNGVPLFVEEVARMLLDSGQLVVRDNEVTIEGEIEDISIPSSLRDLLAAKIDSVPEAKQLACLCSILGREFSYNLVRAVSLATDTATEARLRSLINASILTLEPVGETQKLSFTHALLHEAAYSMLLHSDRREQHLRVARAMETQPSLASEKSPQIVAHHYERGERPVNAARYLLEAGERALELAAAREALEHFERGLRLLGPMEESPSLKKLGLRLHASIGTTHMLDKGWGAPEVERAYESAIKLSEAADLAEQIWISWGAWVYQQVSGNIASSAALADSILATAEQSGNDDALLIAHMIQLQKNFYTGNFNKVLLHGEQLANLYNDTKHEHLTRSYSTNLLLVWHVHASQARWIMGDDRGAQMEYEAAEKIATGSRHAHSIAWFLTWGANYFLLQGKFDRILESVPRGLEIARKHQFDYTLSLGQIILGEAREVCEEDSGDEMSFAQALSAFHQTGAGIAAPYFLTRQASILAQHGRLGDAREKLENAISISERLGETWSLALSQRVLGDILSMAAEPDLAAAEASYIRAIEVASDQGANRWRLEAEEALHKLLVGQNRDKEAAALWDSLQEGGLTA